MTAERGSAVGGFGFDIEAIISICRNSNKNAQLRAVSVAPWLRLLVISVAAEPLASASSLVSAAERLSAADLAAPLAASGPVFGMWFRGSPFMGGQEAVRRRHVLFSRKICMAAVSDLVLVCGPVALPLWREGGGEKKTFSIFKKDMYGGETIGGDFGPGIDMWFRGFSFMEGRRR